MYVSSELDQKVQQKMRRHETDSSRSLRKDDSSKSSDTVGEEGSRDEFGIRLGSSDFMKLFDEDHRPFVVEKVVDNRDEDEEAPLQVLLPPSSRGIMNQEEEEEDDEEEKTSSKLLDTVYECSSSLDTETHSIDSEMNEALDHIKNPSLSPTRKKLSPREMKEPTRSLPTVLMGNNLTTPSAKLPLGLFFSGKLRKRSRNRSIFRSMTHVVSWKVRSFRLVVQSEFRLILEYAPPVGDRKIKSKATRKWEQIVLTPDMTIALAKDCNLKPHVLQVLGEIKAKSPIDSASPESRLAFQIRKTGKIDGGIILECETTDKKMFNGWVKALGLALLSLRESFAAKNMLPRKKATSRSCPTLITNSLSGEETEKESSAHFTASMAVRTIQRNFSTNSNSLDRLNLRVRESSNVTTNSSSGVDGDESESSVGVGWGSLMDTDTDTSKKVKRSMSIRPAIELKDGGAIFSNSTSKRRIVSDVVMKDLVPYSSSPDSKDRPMELGKGASGGAHLFRDRRSPAILYAVKSVGLFGESNRNQVLHELEALAETGSSGDEGERSITPSERQKVSDEHCVVHLHGHSIEKNQMQLILEYMNLGGLDRLVKTGCKVPEKVVAGMMWQVFEALKYMKTVKNMMHRDIKPANILWCTNGRVKVGDFGISRKMSDDNQAHTFLGTHLYMSPERYEPPYSYPADVYSTAIVMCELVSAIHPLIGRGVHVNEIHSHFHPSMAGDGHSMADGQMQLRIYDAIRKDSIDLPMLKDASKELRDLTKQTLMRNPSLRPSASKILFHPWFKAHGIDSLKKAVDVVRRYAKSNSRYLNMETEMLKLVEAEKRKLNDQMNDGKISAKRFKKILRKYAIVQTSKIRNAGLCPVGLLHDAIQKTEEKSASSVREL